MTEPMTLERFRLLADAYGGAVATWPDNDRSEAYEFAMMPEGRIILKDAAALDMALDDWRTAAVSNGFSDRIIASFPLAAASVARRVRLWWSGIGIAASLTGAVAGSACVAVLLPAPIAVDGATSFGSLGGADEAS